MSDTQVSDWSLTDDEKAELRHVALDGMTSWRLIASVSLSRTERAKKAILEGIVSVGELRQEIADECGVKANSVRKWEGLERQWHEHLDELPKGILFTYHQLDYVPRIAKIEGKDKLVVFYELIDEAISRRDRLGEDSGENVLVASLAVLANRAKGKKPNKNPVLDPLDSALNFVVQAYKHSEGTAYAPWRVQMAVIEKQINALIREIEKATT